MPSGVYLRTEEHCKKISDSLKGENAPWFGKSFSEEHRNKLSAAHIGKHHLDESKRKIGNSHRGKHHSEETIEKIRFAHKRENLSEETRRKLSEACRGEKNHNYGKHPSEETRAKLRLERAKRVIPFKDTSIEVIMQQALSELHIMFETHKAILGQPDIFIEPNICIFCDGDYWHTTSDAVRRDKLVNDGLQNQGYIVLRFWEHDIHDNLKQCLEIVTNCVQVIGVRRNK